MNEERLHQEYKNRVCKMLFDFSLDFNQDYTDLERENMNLKDLQEYIEDWVEIRFSKSK